MSCQEFEDCNTCAGTGLGQWGEVGTTLCLSCEGTGKTYTSECEDEIYDDEREYQRWKETA